jgi:hypothetical protein
VKRNAVYLMSSVLSIASLSYAGETVRTFRGEISDSQCAMNVHSLTHSHQEMLKSKGLIGGTSADCANRCAKQMGGEFVLAAGKEVYHLDNQAEAERFAGQKVKISGTLDAKAKTIHVVTTELGK